MELYIYICIFYGSIFGPCSSDDVNDTCVHLQGSSVLFKSLAEQSELRERIAAWWGLGPEPRLGFLLPSVSKLTANMCSGGVLPVL